MTDRAHDAALVRAFNLLGKRWNGILIATLLSGPTRFADLRRAVAGIGDSVLAARLMELSDAGLVQRSVDEGPPIAVDYRLSERGRALSSAMAELAAWAAVNLDA